MCDIGAGASNIYNGLYSVMWDGVGDVLFSPNVQFVTHEASLGRAQVNINVVPGSTSGISVRIRSNSTNPLRNLRIVPVAFQSNYTSQIFHPSFLKAIAPFSTLRFTGWQKLSSSSGKLWQNRTLPTSQSQHGSDGVAIEHMIDLAVVTKAKAVWFSFPTMSQVYNKNMIALLATKLPRNITLYYESGCPEAFGDSNRYQETMYLIALFNKTFAADPLRFNLKPTVSVGSQGYAAYVLGPWFGTQGLQQIRAVAFSSQFGAYSMVYDNYSTGQLKLQYANYTDAAIMEDVRATVFNTEMFLNQYRQQFLSVNPKIEIVAYNSGPLMSANTYGYRAGEISILNCAKNKKFPCTWANTGYNFVNQSAVTAAAPMMRYNATLEQLLENRLIALERSRAIQDIYMDLLERWRRLGGGLLVGSNLVQPPLTCPTGGKGCGNHGMFENSFYTDCTALAGGCPKYDALVQYAAGRRSALPFTSADLAPDWQLAKQAAAPCSPACKWGRCYWGKCVCFAGYSGATCTTVVAKRNDCNNHTGINVAGVVDWSSEWPYVDLYRSSRAWISQTFASNTPWSTGQSISLDRFENPTSLQLNQKIGSMMMRDLQGHMRAGTFICLYDGDGIITFSMDIFNVRRSVGRIEVTVRPSIGLNNGVFLMIERTNPLDPIRNIRFVMPGFEDRFLAQPFHPLFLNSLKDYKTLRFMDFANTNSVRYGNWSDRSTDLTRSYSSAATSPTTGGSSPGVPIEDMVLLSNIIGADAWFNMPHLCTDDFVTNFATLVYQTLRPDVKIYIEYSNEVWGTLFLGGQYAQTMGLKLQLSTDPSKARFCYYVLRSSQIFTLWKAVFGADAGRLQFVYSSQAVQPYVSQLMLQCQTTLAVKTKATVLATAPYFGAYNPSTDPDINKFMTVTLPAQIDSLKVDQLSHYSWAKKFNMTLAMYEGGQGLGGTSNPSQNFVLLANRDSRMAGLYVRYFRMLQSAGVSLSMQYSSTGLYSTTAAWGLLESTDQNLLSSPKYLGVQQYLAATSSCPSSAPAPSSAFFGVNSASCADNCHNAGICTDSNKCECYYGIGGPRCENQTYTEHRVDCTLQQIL